MESSEKLVTVNIRRLEKIETTSLRGSGASTK